MKNIKTYQEFANEEINLKKVLTGAALGAGLAFSSPSFSQDIKKTTPQEQTKIQQPKPYFTVKDSPPIHVSSIHAQGEPDFEELEKNVELRIGDKLIDSYYDRGSDSTFTNQENSGVKLTSTRYSTIKLYNVITLDSNKIEVTKLEKTFDGEEIDTWKKYYLCDKSGVWSEIKQ